VKERIPTGSTKGEIVKARGGLSGTGSYSGRDLAENQAYRKDAGRADIPMERDGSKNQMDEGGQENTFHKPLNKKVTKETYTRNLLESGPPKRCDK